MKETKIKDRTKKERRGFRPTLCCSLTSSSLCFFVRHIVCLGWIEIDARTQLKSKQQEDCSTSKHSCVAQYSSLGLVRILSARINFETQYLSPIDTENKNDTSSGNNKSLQFLAARTQRRRQQWLLFGSIVEHA